MMNGKSIHHLWFSINSFVFCLRLIRFEITNTMIVVVINIANKIDNVANIFINNIMHNPFFNSNFCMFHKSQLHRLCRHFYFCHLCGIHQFFE